MKIVLIGIPGAGKGSISELLKKEYFFEHISTGAILRKEVAKKSEIGVQVKILLEKGKLISDELMVNIIKTYLAKAYPKVILDGFPRTVKQAEALSKIVQIDKVLVLKLEEKTAVDRLLKRRDTIGNKRKDDNEQVIHKRMNLFYQEVDPLINFYKEKKVVCFIDVDASLEEVFKRVLNKLEL